MQKPRSRKSKSKRTEKAETVFVVVWVMSGVPNTVEVYRDEKTASARELELQEEADENDDVVTVFEVEVGAKSDESN